MPVRIRVGSSGSRWQTNVKSHSIKCGRARALGTFFDWWKVLAFGAFWTTLLVLLGGAPVKISDRTEAAAFAALCTTATVSAGILIAFPLERVFRPPVVYVFLPALAALCLAGWALHRARARKLGSRSPSGSANK